MYSSCNVCYQTYLNALTKSEIYIAIHNTVTRLLTRTLNSDVILMYDCDYTVDLFVDNINSCDSLLYLFGHNISVFILRIGNVDLK